MRSALSSERKTLILFTYVNSYDLYIKLSLINRYLAMMIVIFIY